MLLLLTLDLYAPLLTHLLHIHLSPHNFWLLRGHFRSHIDSGRQLLQHGQLLLFRLFGGFGDRLGCRLSRIDLQ